jgi:hypothetical protein
MEALLPYPRRPILLITCAFGVLEAEAVKQRVEIPMASGKLRAKDKRRDDLNNGRPLVVDRDYRAVNQAPQ